MKIKPNKSLEPDISEVISKIKDFGGNRIKFIVSCMKIIFTDHAKFKFKIFERHGLNALDKSYS